MRIYRDPDYNPDIKGYSYNLVFNNFKGSFDIKSYNMVDWFEPLVQIISL